MDISFLNISLTHFIDTIVIPFSIPCLTTFFALIIGICLKRYINNLITKKYSIHEDSFYHIILISLSDLPIILSLCIGIHFTITLLYLPEKIDTILHNILLALIVFSIARFFSRSLNGIIELKTSRLGRSSTSTSLLSNIVSFSIYTIFALSLLSLYGISITPLITALGIGSMAIAFGLQETLANVFAGLHLIISRQVRLDDYVRLSGGEEGRVIDISWRFTTILSAVGNAIIIPNQKFASSILTNYNMPLHSLTIKVSLGVSYDSDLEHVERVTLEVANQVMSQLEVSELEPPVLRFHTFGDSSINFDVFLRTNNFPAQALLKHEFIKALTTRYRKENIEIPYPIRTVIEKHPDLSTK